MAQQPTAVASAVRPNEPARQVIATFDDYADAEGAVDYLVDRQFEVNRLAIVGRDLQLIEQVTGKMNYGLAALRGAASGGLVGALIGVILYAMQHGRRDFATVTSLQPRYFDIVADVGVAQRALQLLGEHRPNPDSNRRE